jgi:hypothetical protein
MYFTLTRLANPRCATVVKIAFEMSRLPGGTAQSQATDQARRTPLGGAISLASLVADAAAST